MLPDTNRSRGRLRLIKRLLYSQMALRDAVLILFGRAQPSLSFKVLADPSSIYFNFALKPDKVEAFSRYINLPQDFSLAPISCLADEEPALLLTLNIYEVSGIVSGLRAEWSTYVADRDGTPRYMVLEALAGKGSMDPVNLFTRPDRVEHVMTSDAIVSTAQSKDGGLFHAHIALRGKFPLAAPAPEWIAANDYIYWRNGVCDRTRYDAGLFNAPVRVVPPRAVKISNQTRWADFVDSKPRHVLKYDGELEFMIAPWFNV